MTIFSKFVNILNPKMWIIGDLSPPMNTTTIFGTLVICVISYYLFKCLSGDGNVRIRDGTKNHNWIPIKITAKSWYCSICESLLLNGIGVYCDCCGVCADSECVKKANEQLHCKVLTSNNESHVHHWVKGNLPLGAVCAICHEDCSLEPGLVDQQCCWCQRTVHTTCLSRISKNCDLGPFRNMIVPPWCVQIARRKGNLNRNVLLLRDVKQPGWNNWTPLLVIANKKSGNNDGAIVLSEFRKYLNPLQVIDLADQKPNAALQMCALLAPKEVKILIGGGDGTVAWILTASHKLDLDPEPPIAIVPLGTGNDLSRVLGWGRENPSEINVSKLLRQVQTAKVSKLDRWKVEILSNRHLGLRIPIKTFFMYNYLGIGVDAQVALNFHKTRDSLFYVFGSRIFNKILYLCFGTHQVVTSDCRNLEQRLDLFLDGERIELPELESIVVVNIPSWGAGVNLWSHQANSNSSDSGNGSGSGKISSHQSYHDGILEVVGIYSSFHIAQLQVGLSSPIKLGQAKIVEIKLRTKSPVQIDGEPWEQNPATIRISLVNRCPVLINQNRE